jgi:RNA polymerase sigma factor (sigma-70 family)
LEASALTHASQRGLLARRSPLLKLQGDERLIAMARSGNAGAFETIVDRYQGRLLGFCRQMLGSTEDAEDVLQEVFVNAYRAMLADEREINLRPWLYRIARNRCLNHLRKPTADAQESMDMVPVVEAASTAEKVHNREEFRQLLDDVGKLPETQRTALLLREMDAMSYEEIAAAMETSVPSVKSLLVRARISLAEASQARQLTCGEVRLELAEAAEGLRKVSGPVRRHVRDCEECADFRSQVRSNDKVLAALFPAGALVALKGFIVSKLGLGGASGTAGAGGATGGAGAAASAGAGATATTAATATGASAVGSVGAAIGSGAASGGIGAVGGAIGTKAVAGVVTAAVITPGAAGAVEVNQKSQSTPPARSAAAARIVKHTPAPSVSTSHPALAKADPQAQMVVAPPPAEAPAPAPPPPAPKDETQSSKAAGQSNSVEADDEPASPKAKATAPKLTAAKSPAGTAGAPTGGETVVVTVGGTKAPAEATPPPEEAAPSEGSPPPSEGTPPSEPAPPVEGGTEEKAGASGSGAEEAAEEPATGEGSEEEAPAAE